jgi:hypothetical protein
LEKKIMFLNFNTTHGLHITATPSPALPPLTTATKGEISDVVAEYKTHIGSGCYCPLEGARAALEDCAYLADSGLDDFFQDAIEDVHAFLVEHERGGGAKATYRIESDACNNKGGVMAAGFSSVADAIADANSWGRACIALTENFDGHCWSVVNKLTGEAVCYLADLHTIAEKYKIEPGEAFYVGAMRVDSYSAEEIAELA